MIRAWLALTVTAAAFGWAAGAAAAPASGALLFTPRPAPEREAPATPATLPYALNHDIGEPGIATTSVERRYARRGVTGSAGFLCGRQDIAVRDGSAGAYDSDPHGRFVGASLRLVFR